MTADFVSETPDSLDPVPAVVGRRPRLDKWAVVGAIPLALVLAWVLLFARGTSAGSAVSEPGEFVVVYAGGLRDSGSCVVADGSPFRSPGPRHGR